MSFLGKFLESNTKMLLNAESLLLNQIRGKQKKAVGSTRNAPRNTTPKHRGWKVQDGAWVPAHKILATQRKLRFHPGLNVGFGRNGTLFALEPGRVVVTCEEINPDWERAWIQRTYAGREGDAIHKKHFNVIPMQQHNRFKLIDEV